MIVSKQQKKKGNSVIFSSIVVQSLWYVQILVNPWIIACQASLSFTISQSLLKFVSTESVMLSNFLILCHSLLLLPSIFSSIKFLWFLAFVCLLPVSWLFTSGGQSFETSASTAVFVMDIWCWIFWNWLVWYPCCLRDSQESSPAPRFKKCQFFDTQPSLCLNSHICTWLLNKNIIQLYGP